MPTAFRIFLESKEAFGVSGAGHLYLVLRQVTVDSNEAILSNAYNPDADRTIGATSVIAGGLSTAEQLLKNSNDAYGSGVTPNDRHSQDITAWLGLSNISGEADSSVESAWSTLKGAIDALDGKYSYELPYDPEGITVTVHLTPAPVVSGRAWLA